MMNNTRKCLRSSSPLHFLEDNRPQLHSITIGNETDRTLRHANSITQKNTSLCSSSMWTIKDENLPNLPVDFPLLKTHALIHRVPPSIIASRILEVMSDLSIAAHYDEKKAALKAETMDHVSFKVRLYSSGNKEKLGAIVEVQRLSGCSFSFGVIYRSIIRACNGMPIEYPKPLPISIPLSVIDRSCKSESDDVDVDNAIHIARILLGKNDIDSNLLGLESLGILTDTSKTALCKASRVANAVFDEATIRDKVIMLVMPSDGNQTGSDGIKAIMHRRALTVLSNSLTLLASSDRLDDVVENDCYLAECLVSVLLKKVQHCQVKPHDAFLSIKCLEALMSVVALRCVPLDSDIQEVIQTLQGVGQCRHNLLRRESLKLLRVLECVS